MLKSLARFSARRPLAVLLLWIIAAVGIQTASVTAGSGYSNSFSQPGTDSQQALDLLQRRFPQASGDADRLVIRADDGRVDAPEVKKRVDALLAEVSDVPAVGAVISPYRAGPAQVSQDGSIGYATVQYDGRAENLPKAQLEQIIELTDAASQDGLTTAIGGQGVGAAAAPTLSPTELIGLAFAAVVLLLAFGSVVAMTLPILTAIVALIAGLGGVGLLSHVVSINTSAPLLAVLLGLGVGIDYALFIVNRHRTQLRAGTPIAESIVTAIDTSGRAVLFAGITVVIALLGLFVTGDAFLYGMAIASGVAVAATVLAAVTLLPALLALAGSRVLGRRARRDVAAGQVVTESAGRAFAGWAAVVRRRPALTGGVAAAVLLLLAAPVLSLRLGSADQGNDAEGSTTRVAYDLLADGFGPGFNGPLLIAVDASAHPLLHTSAGDAPGTAAVPAALRTLTTELNADPGVAAVSPAIVNADGSAAIVQVSPTASPQDEATSELITRVRSEIIPEAIPDGITAHVGGSTATFDDFADTLQGSIPLFVGTVIALSFVLLVLAFRSIVVPLVGAVLNLVSAAAAFGVIVAVFQWGWAGSLLGLGKPGPVDAFTPAIMFALLFGLSMDYQVFLVSRIHEEWVRSRDNTRAVTVGHSEAGRVVVAAAAIMVFVFGAFVLGDARFLKLFGFGLAAGVLLDALLIRMILVPALLHRIGPATWSLPGWLDRVLPHLSVEGESGPIASPEPVVAPGSGRPGSAQPASAPTPALAGQG